MLPKLFSVFVLCQVREQNVNANTTSVLSVGVRCLFILVSLNLFVYLFLNSQLVRVTHF